MRTTFFLLLLLLAAACDKEAPPEADDPTPASNPTPLPAGTTTAEGWTVVDEAALEPAQRDALARARAAQKTLGKTLKGRLKKAVDEAGLASAVEVCHAIAPKLAEAVRRDTGVALGRTSFKLRNPDNTPPAWSVPVVEARSEAPHVLTGPYGQVASLTPIFVDGLCLKCHGSDSWRDPAVDPILAEHYPEDEATGFEPGELRGWFWAVAE